MPRISHWLQCVAGRFRSLQEEIYAQAPGFYDLIAGGLIGGGIQEAASALEELDEKGACRTLLRLVAVIALVLAGALLVRIARILEEIERAYQAGSPDLIEIQRGERKSVEETEAALKEFRRRVRIEKDKRRIVVPSFRFAFLFILLAFFLFLVAGLDPRCNCILSLWQWILQTLRWIVQTLQSILQTLQQILQSWQ